MQQPIQSGLMARIAPREKNLALPSFALAYGLGIWLATRVRAGLWPLWLLAMAALALAALWLMRKPRYLALLPVWLMSGLLIAMPMLHPELPQAGPYGQITATVSGDPMPREDGRIALFVTEVVLDGELQRGKAYLTIYPESGVTVDALFDGALLHFAGTAYHPMGKQNIHDFDFRMWLLQNGVTYGLTTAKGVQVANTPATAPWVDAAARIRRLCAAQLERLMGEESSLAMGMLLGVRDALPEQQQRAFQTSGVMHLMSVSGLHVALIAGVLAWAFARLAIRRAVRLPVMAALIIGYCMLTGFAAATVRATVMVLLTLMAHAAGRRAEPFSLLCGAALIVLLLQPLDLFSAGFVLSFAAMAGILLLYPPLKRRLARESGRKPGKAVRVLHRLLGKPGELFALSLSAQAGVALPSAQYFHALPLYGILFNMMAVPLAGLLVPLYALVLLISYVPWLGNPLGVGLGWVAALGSKVLLWLVGLSTQMPFAQVRVPTPSLWAYAVAALAMVAGSPWLRATARRRVVAMALVTCIAAGGWAATRPAAVRYHQMAAGQADAALVMDGTLTIALDVGEYGSEVANRLLAEGRDVDALILTHLHRDHALGVQMLLSQGIQIRQAYVPLGTEATTAGQEGYDTLQLLRKSGVPITLLAAGDRLVFDQTSLQVLWPQQATYRAGRSENDLSMATLLTLDKLRILGMADVSGRYEEHIAVDCDVLKVGHHGSASGTGAAFLQRCSPQIALVTVRSNAALPAEATLQRLADQGVPVLRTDMTGEVIIEQRPQGYRILTYKAGAIHGS